MSEPASEVTPKRVIKQPKEKRPSFLDRPVTRRDFLKLTAAAGGAYLLKDILDSGVDTDEYTTPERVNEAILFLKKLNLELPQDQLYGFTFPSTGEVAQKYEEALAKKIGNPPISSLIIVQEKEPKTLVRSVKLLVGLEEKHESPAVNRSRNPDSHSLLYLPHYTQKDSVAEMALTLYHEGIHLFYQKAPSEKRNSQEIFDDENMPSIADAVLDQLLRTQGYKIGQEFETNQAYFRAVGENNRGIWEQQLKKLYELPADCCTFRPSSK